MSEIKYDNNEAREIPLNIFIYDCKKCELGGIKDVAEFNESCIYLSCKYGEVSIEGDNLKIRNFNGSTGDLTVDGNIRGVFRIDKNVKKGKKKNTLFG